VRQNGKIINEKEKLAAVTSMSPAQLQAELDALHEKKQKQTIMIVSEGTVFLLLLLFGIYKIKQAHDKENQLNDQQNNFFLSITHELKTPIAATKLQLQTLQKQKLDEETRQELIGSALLETDRLNMLIDNVLLTSRLDTGEFIFNKEKHEVGELIRSIVSRYYLKELSKGEITMDVTGNIFAEVDVQAFPSVITNLVDNALKYSTTPRKITIALKKEDKIARIVVSDEGCGIPDKAKSRIFTKFYRGGNEETRRTKGTGLGLYIVNYILKKHGAIIRVSDNTPCGSTFEVRMNAV